MDSLLIVEPQEKLARAFTMHLGKHNYDVTIATTLGEAQNVLQVQGTDLLMIDLNISQHKGFLGFYDWLLNDFTSSQVPRIFIQGARDVQMGDNLRERQEQNFVIKPIKLRQLLELVRTLIKEAEFRSATKGYSIDSLLGRTIGSAKVLKQIGKGGMGAVFLGHQESLDRDVAIKVLLPDMLNAPGAMKRFQKEALAIAKLRSPHIVMVYEAGFTTDEIFYIIMEYLAGETLEQFVQRTGRMPAHQARDVIKQVTTGLVTAHDHKLFHRDIKPSNIIFNPNGQVTITDFGLALQHGEIRNTKTGMILGTPHYLSPEQASGKKVDARSDIYSLGIVLYELLVGAPPFYSDNAVAIIMKHMREDLPDPRKQVPELPESLVSIVQKMTHKKPEERFSSGGELLEALSSPDLDRDLNRIEQNHVYITKSYPEASYEFSRDTHFDHELSALNKREPSQFISDNLRGTAVVTETGSFESRDGDFPEDWESVVQISVGLINQIKATTDMGSWRQVVQETPEKTLVLFPRDSRIGCMLFDMKKSSLGFRTSSKNKITGDSTGQSTANPITQIFSVAGVKGILLFDLTGAVLDLKCDDSFDAEQVKLRLTPIPELIKSFTMTVSTLDFWFDRGRVLVSDLGNQILVIIADRELNISLLTLMVNRLITQLVTGTFSSSSQQSMPVIAGPVDNPLPISVVKELQTEFARFIGPISQVTMKKVAKKMGYTVKNFPQEKSEKFIDKISRQLDQTKRTLFTEKALDVIHKYRSSLKK